MATVLTAVVGYVVQAPCGWLFGAAKSTCKRAKMYPTRHSNLISRLEILVPLIAKINDTGTSSVSESLTRTMEDGKELAKRCEEGRLNFFEKATYAKKIRKWEKSLEGHLILLTVKFVAQNESQDLVTPWCAVPHLPKNTLILGAPVEEMKLKLLGDDAPSMLVLTAPRGCGKTTLATMFCHDPEVKAMFQHKIFFAKVSNKPSYIVVQELFQHAGLSVPALENEEIAFRWLPHFLTEAGQSPLLLILDDVPSASESLLDKFDEIEIPDLKILVTSRYHFPKFGPPYNLQPLTDEDALTLFRRSAFLPNTSCDIPEDLQKEIINHCKKFPIAIKTVGTSLRNRPIEKWRIKLTELSKDSILDSEKDLLALLKSCLDDLNKKMAPVKECFIDLALFPKGQRIPVTALLDMWAELYEGSNDNESMVKLYELTYRNLASLVVPSNKDMDGYYGDHFVIQHDMLKLLSIHESCEDLRGHRLIIDIREDGLPPTLSTEQQQKTEKARLISVSTGELSSTEWHNMHLPKCEVLVLNFQAENYALPKFMEEMCMLKVLLVTNNDGFSHAELSDFELLCSLSNLKRLRLERISIPLISMESIQSRSLKKISLFMCNVREAFGNSSIRIFETFPYLEELHIDYSNDLEKLPAKLCDLIRLKVLSITNCYKLSVLPEDIGKLENLEVLRLRSCIGLEELPGSIEKLSKLCFLDIYNCAGIKELPECIGKMNGLRKINMAQCSRLNELPVSVYDLDQQLEKVICDEDVSYLWVSVLSNLDIITVAKEEFNLDWLQFLV
ncbi:hypothetical protein C1H46_021255 [Malus baccata]|uniref:Uncharacterized protein n=1 Tax=Malus baccata TaxID=106549 RepID=A0A540M3T0_MALBA|nr:hypothetical protein C1H46_021255 [Malus baccata]